MRTAAFARACHQRIGFLSALQSTDNPLIKPLLLRNSLISHPKMDDEAKSVAFGMPQISLIIPTINEAENLPALIGRLGDVLRGRDWEAIIVDDASTDGTPAICESLSKDFPIRIISREYPTNGLS